MIDGAYIRESIAPGENNGGFYGHDRYRTLSTRDVHELFGQAAMTANAALDQLYSSDSPRSVPPRDADAEAQFLLELAMMLWRHPDTNVNQLVQTWEIQFEYKHATQGKRPAAPFAWLWASGTSIYTAANFAADVIRAVYRQHASQAPEGRIFREATLEETFSGAVEDRVEQYGVFSQDEAPGASSDVAKEISGISAREAVRLLRAKKATASSRYAPPPAEPEAERAYSDVKIPYRAEKAVGGVQAARHRPARPSEMMPTMTRHEVKHRLWQALHRTGLTPNLPPPNRYHGLIPEDVDEILEQILREAAT